MMQPSGSFCRIYTAEVAPLASSALFDAWYARMPGPRRIKVDRMRFSEGKYLSLGAGALLDTALRSAGLDAASEAFAEGPQGKPFLRDHPEMDFNLSHSGTRILCVLASLPCGCDVERTDRGSPALARRFFAPEETAALEAQIAAGGDPAFHRLFTRIWTRKESFLKATGEGLFCPMNSFSVLAPDPSARFFEAESFLSSSLPDAPSLSSAPQEQTPEYFSCVCLLANAEKNRPDDSFVWPVPEWIPVSLTDFS